MIQKLLPGSNKHSPISAALYIFISVSLHTCAHAYPHSQAHALLVRRATRALLSTVDSYVRFKF